MQKVRLIARNSESMGSNPHSQWPPTHTAIPHGPFPISFPIQIPAVCRARYLPDSPGVVLCVWLPGTTLHPLRRVTKRKHHNTCSTDPVTQFSLLQTHTKTSIYLKAWMFPFSNLDHVFLLRQAHASTTPPLPKNENNKQNTIIIIIIYNKYYFSLISKSSSPVQE